MMNDYNDYDKHESLRPVLNLYVFIIYSSTVVMESSSSSSFIILMQLLLSIVHSLFDVMTIIIYYKSNFTKPFMYFRWLV